MAGVGGAGGSSGGGRGGASSAGRSGGGRGSSGAGKAGKAGGSSADKGSKAGKAEASAKAAEAKAAEAKSKAEAERAADKVETQNAQQKAEAAARADTAAQSQEQARQQDAVQAADEARAATDPVQHAEDVASGTSSASKVAGALTDNKVVGRAGGIAGTIANGIDTAQNATQAVDAALKGDTDQALKSGTDAVISGVKTAAGLADSPLGTAAKIGSRFAGPAAALSAAVDSANFSNSLSTAVAEGGVGNWAQAGWDGVKAGLSTASIVPGIGAVPGAVAGAMDIAESIFGGPSSWFG